MRAAAAANAADLKTSVVALSEHQIVERIRELMHDKQLSHLLVLAVKDDGTTFSADNGLTIEETQELMKRYGDWIEHGRRKIM